MKAISWLPELLLPVGGPDQLRSALLYGADAVYLGGRDFNLRAASGGFDAAALPEAVRRAEAAGVKVYYCLNSLPVQKDLPALPAEIENAAEAGAHALIVADPGVLRLARKYAPGLPVHLSTQANTTNAEAVAFWLDQGVERLNLARELCRDDIAAIRAARPQAALEIFVQGAMCLAVSGQCLLSAWLNRRPANAGRCTQPCRFEYRAARALPLESLIVEEALRPGAELWRVREDENYSSFWAPEDLCLLPYLPWFRAQGVNALKVEGRTKSAAYVAHAADVYRSALDGLNGPDALSVARCDPDAAAPNRPDATGSPNAGLAGGGPFDPAPFLRELMYVSSRPLGSGFFLPGERKIWPRPDGWTGRVVLARILEESAPGRWLMELRANWPENAPVELMLPGLRRPLLERYELINHRGEPARSLPNGVRATLVCDEAGIEPGIFIRASA